MLIAALCLLPQSMPAIIPAPLSYRSMPGSFDIVQRTTIVASGKAKDVAERLREFLRPSTGFDLFIDSHPKPRSISLTLDEQQSSALGNEGYRLSASPDGIVITAAKPAGLFYGAETLRQLLPTRAFDRKPTIGAGWTVPGCEIVDRPRFGWRGILLDVSRHFYPPKFIEEMIDWLAVHKMNVFHWHLVDDGGWRVEIKKYPKLTQVGAWREERPVEWSYTGLHFPGQDSGKKLYGGFYTQNDIKDIVKYAADRFVNIVPEIEMPGHSTDAVAAYPELGCNAPADIKNKYIADIGNDQPSMVCAGKDSVRKFYKDVLDEVMALFPSSFIHIGGDEVDKSLWVSCPDCQARKQAKGLKSEDELQSDFIQEMDAYLDSKGRRLIGWDEILEGGLAPKAAVMSWRGIEGGIAAAKANHDVVMSPTSNCYFDYPYSSISTATVYGYEPVPGALSAQEASRVLGGQGNIWTEWLSSDEEIESMMFPRAAALAEVLWTKFERKDFGDFSQRLLTHYERLDKLGIAYYVAAPKPKADLVLLGSTQPVEFERPETPNSTIRFTVDGKEPTGSSAAYMGPIRLNRPGIVKAAVFRPSGTKSETVSVRAISIKTDDSAKIAGVNRRVVEGAFSKCPAFDAFRTAVAKNVTEIGLGEFAGKDNFALQYDGYLRIPADGEYTFWLGSDDGSKMWLGDILAIDNDGLHPNIEKRLKLTLPKGDYPFRIIMFEQGGSEALKLSVEGPGLSVRQVPESWLWSKS
jgi:hexosaminidase